MRFNNQSDLKKFLSELPDESIRDFELQIVSICTDKQPEAFLSWVKSLLDENSTSAKQDKVAFSAFCILINYARRSYNRTKEAELLSNYSERFSKHVFLNHIKLLCMLDNRTGLNNNDILELAFSNCKAMPQNAGVHHALADAVAIIFEDSEFSSAKKPDYIWLQRGETAIQCALDKEKTYAKFYCTKARILSLRGKHEEAITNINTAIDYEDSNKVDYALRVGKYQTYSQLIRMRQHNQTMKKHLDIEFSKQKQNYLDEIKHQQDEMEESIARSRIKNMEFLGLFAGIISFTIGAINISQNLAVTSIIAAVGLIIVLMGALLGVFAGFGIILHGYKGDESVRNYIVLVLGVLVMLGGVYLCFL